MLEFKNSITGDNATASFNPVFQLPEDLINLFRALVVQTGNVDLTLRGDGLQAKLIPEILNFIAIKELSFTSGSIKSGYKAKKYFIWGFEEPENSYEYRNAQILANKFQNEFYKNAQIFISTHSFNFLSLEGEHVSKFRVWKDESTVSSKISRLKRDNKGALKFESISDFKTDWKKLEEELGFFYLNDELKELYDKQENDLKLLEERIQSVDKPIIYSEGYNMNLLKRAKEIYFPELDVEFGDLGGKTEIKQFFQKLSRTNYNRFKMVFIFDCDAKGEFEACNKERSEYLIPYLLEQNSNNNIEEVQSGIENLFAEELFEDEALLFDVNEHLRNGTVQSRKRKLRKTVFEKLILNTRNENSDFVNFEPCFKYINEQLNGTQSSSPTW